LRPTISVVLAAYNAGWCIERGLDSVMAQTAPALEVLVCDDGSTDGTAELVERRYGMRVQVLRLPHRNASAARADGLSRARGDWLALLDADDWWEPAKLDHQLAFVQQHPELAWVSSDGDFRSDEGVLRDSWLSDYFAPVTERTGDLFPLLVRRCFPLLSSSLVRRDAYAAVGGLDPTIPHSYDYDLCLRLAARYPCGVLAERLVHYWSHPGQLSRSMEARHREDLAIMRRIANGELRDDADARAAGRARAAALAFDLGLICLREGRASEARELFRAAAASGPVPRRAFALAGSLLPGFAVPAVRRLGWLKGGVAGARERKRVLPASGEAA
jgi:glycosyltransferase involved in cell wall biosynthesis